jgi:hypothetical protein
MAIQNIVKLDTPAKARKSAKATISDRNARRIRLQHWSAGLTVCPEGS